MNKGDTQEINIQDLPPPERPIVMTLFDNRGDWEKFIETSDPYINIQYFKDLVRWCGHVESQRAKTK